MYQLPSVLVARADQAKAQTDEVVSELVEALRGDLQDGVDPTYLWWTIASGFALDSPDRLAAALSAAMLKLARIAPAP